MQIAAGGFHAAALTHDGEVYTWGLGKQGALGHGDQGKSATPKRVTALRGVRIEQVPPAATFCALRLHVGVLHDCATLFWMAAGATDSVLT